jgi:hypothetical protein
MSNVLKGQDLLGSPEESIENARALLAAFSQPHKIKFVPDDFERGRDVPHLVVTWNDRAKWTLLGIWRN